MVSWERSSVGQDCSVFVYGGLTNGSLCARKSRVQCSECSATSYSLRVFLFLGLPEEGDVASCCTSSESGKLKAASQDQEVLPLGDCFLLMKLNLSYSRQVLVPSMIYVMETS